ncbi:MAG: PF20097 family protein [Verrucomicrobia bacterium]|nr:PF20097 family protein [Verrucomicrobiota bacterium]
MKCPNCQTPMEEGLIDRACFIPKLKPGRLMRLHERVFNFLYTPLRHGARRVIAHRCPDCSRVELTAP